MTNYDRITMTRSLILAAAFALAACGGADKAALPADDATPSVTPTPEPVASATITSEIPASLRGRWGLVAADCEAGRSDAKGLLVVSADKLEFYESVGKLGPVSDAGNDRLRAMFAFTGEGMEWTRDMLLETESGGTVLVRREFGTDAAPEPFRYNKCP